MNNRKPAKRKRTQLWLGISFISLIFGLILTSFLYQRAKNSLWDGKSSFSVVEQIDNQLVVKSVIPEQARQIKIILPSNVQIKAPFGYGEYLLNKVYDLGKLDKQGGRVLTRSVQNLLGLEVQGYKVGKESNLTWWDKLRLNWFLNLNLKTTHQLDLIETAVFSKEQLSDGTDVFRPSLILLDELINQYYFNEKIIEEALEIAVLNASLVSNAASEIARTMTNLGAEVIKTDNQDIEESSFILVKQKDFSNFETVKVLQRLLGVEEVTVGGIDGVRAEMVAVIGTDYVKIE